MCVNRFRFFLLFLFISLTAAGQSLIDMTVVRENGAALTALTLDDSTVVKLSKPRVLFSFRLEGVYFESGDVPAGVSGGGYIMVFPGGIEATYTPADTIKEGLIAKLVLRNNWRDTITVADVVPFGEKENSAWITSYGPPSLTRAHLFLPGRSPVGVILPDNAWEMGFTTFPINDMISVSAIARRTAASNGTTRRYETILPPGASVTYHIHADTYKGSWQEGLRTMFARRWLYDLSHFDDKLYRRDDLQWIRNSYLMVQLMAWDRQLFDRFTGEEHFSRYLTDYNSLFGHVDVFGIWPSWPRLGLDERNQWDLYRDLPGGTETLRRISSLAKREGSRLFIAYNPWDRSTRNEDHLTALTEMISRTEADGVIIDTEARSSAVLQETADSVRKGVVFYSEGMPVIKDMPGIVAARVHNAIFLSPELNLNKLVRPDFAIFRVADVGEDLLHREISVAFFNGYGTELNMYRPGGRDKRFRDDLEYLAQTTYILRHNSDAFTGGNWTPLIESSIDKVYVNSWHAGEKQIFTVLGMDHRGYSGPLFAVGDTTARHLVSLYRHEELDPLNVNGELMVPVSLEGWSPADDGTRRESTVDCVALLPRIIKARLDGDRLYIAAGVEGMLTVTAGAPGYNRKSIRVTAPAESWINAGELFGVAGEKIVIELTDSEGILLDERVVRAGNGPLWMVSERVRTTPPEEVPPEMVTVPAATITYRLHANDEFIPYPNTGREITVTVDSFLIDRYPVTNEQYLQFIRATRYIPADTSNYLRHWERGMPLSGQERYPVVWITIEDARAYAQWAGKRLPTEAEWQLAAQGTDQRQWPWGDEFHATKCNNGFGRPTPVDAFPKGESPYGAADLVGNVWQMTADVWCDGAYYFNIIRGGSWFRPASGEWYLRGGPQPLTYTQMQLLVSPGFDRSATVGFRCVMDL